MEWISCERRKPIIGDNQAKEFLVLTKSGARWVANYITNDMGTGKCTR